MNIRPVFCGWSNRNTLLAGSPGAIVVVVKFSNVILPMVRVPSRSICPSPRIPKTACPLSGGMTQPAQLAGLPQLRS